MTFFYDLNKRMAELANKQDLHESKVAESEKWIQKAVNPAHKGNLHKALHVAQGETIPKAKIAKATHSKNPKLRHMAQFAKNVAHEGVDKEAFAKLAPPTDKITFADKIAGAKKEVDEMLGDVAAEAMKAAVGKGKHTVTDEGDVEDFVSGGGKITYGKAQKGPRKPGLSFGSKHIGGGGDKMKPSRTGRAANTQGKPVVAVEDEMDEGFADMDAWLKSREKEKGTGEFDKKERTLPGGMKATTYTRKHEDDEEDRDDSKDKQADKYASPKKKGRPQSAAPKDAERVTKGSHKYKMVAGKRVEKDRPTKTKEDLDSDSVMMTNATNCSSEGAADKSALKSAIALLKKNGYNISKKEVTDEIAPPGAKAERMVKHIKQAYSKDGKLTPKEKAIAYATTWKAKKAGKVEEEKVDETTTSGSVATASAAPAASKGMQFGKGVYESFNSSVEQMITETMNVSVNMNAGEDGQTRKSITVSAEGEEADQLAALLKMAGLHGQSSGSCGCGNTPCSCDETVEEAYGDTDETLNDPDWPTDTETLPAQPELRTYSGGLNGPKSTGQTTIPVVASQLRRQASMEENVKLERSLFKTWKNYKG